MDKTIEDLILDELKTINEKLDSYSARATAIETQIKPLFPNGQQGTLADLDERITSLEQFKWWSTGAGTAIGTLVGVITTFIFELFKGKNI